MSDSALPDDLNLWPEEPYALLALERGADATVAKRAYLKLIRVYKPEHEPQKFQRIRTAYEQVLARIAFHLQFGLPLDAELHVAPAPATSGDSSNGTPEDAASDASAVDSSAPAETAAPRPPTAPPPNEPKPLDAAWQLAIAGDFATAYARLVELAPGDPSGAAHARLYWLVSFVPEISTRRPGEWLVEGLVQTRLMGPLRELFRRHVLADPAEALRPECDELLLVPTQSGPLLDLADMRWLAAARSGRYDVVLKDLVTLRPRVATLDDETWARLLLSAVDFLAWANHNHFGKAFEALCREVDEMGQVHVTLSGQLLRLDMLRELVDGWRKIAYASDVPDAWREAVPVCWNEPWDRIKAKLWPVVRQIAESPQSGLGVFDALRKHSHAAAALLGNALDQLRREVLSEPADERSDEQAMIDAVVLFSDRGLMHYAMWRQDFLEFCVSEAIEPELAGRILDELFIAQNRYPGASWADQISDDGPLRAAYSSCRLWGR